MTYQEIKIRKEQHQNHERPEDVHCHAKDTLVYHGILIGSRKGCDTGPLKAHLDEI